MLQRWLGRSSWLRHEYKSVQAGREGQKLQPRAEAGQRKQAVLWPQGPGTEGHWRPSLERKKDISLAQLTRPGDTSTCQQRPQDSALLLAAWNSSRRVEWRGERSPAFPLEANTAHSADEQTEAQ